MTDIMGELKPIGALFTAGNYTDALIQLECLWEKIPHPKEATLNSYMIVAYGAIIGIKAKNLDKAWEWAQRGLSYSGNFNLVGESEFLVGEVAYARSDFVAAAKYFKIVKKMSGKRLFKSKDPKYLQLAES